MQLRRLKRAIAGLDLIAILPGDMHVLFDGGKEGNRSKMKAAFVDDQGNALTPKAARALQLVFSEDTASLRQSQRCLLVTQPKPLSLIHI